MLKRLWIMSAALVALASPAFAQPAAAPLPDFPPDAEPGACYARMRADAPGAPAAERGVWTLKRGHGPEAVWSYSEVPGAAPVAGGYRWVRVLCEDGRTPYGPDVYAHRGPATGTTGAGLEPPPPPMAVPPPPEPPMVPPPPPPAAPPPEFGFEGPHHVPAFPPRPPHHGPMFGGFPPMGPHFAGPPMPPPPPVSPPRWFGDRYLSWAGKRPPVW